ncbi:MAG TPA: DUF4138 domain-containing protein, partial [Puia sp.]|nr:DUF4138 domain-containing protein [Puia sp.]
KALDHLFSVFIRSSDNSTSTVPAHAPGGKPGLIGQTDLKRCCAKIAGDIQRIYFLKARNGRMKLLIKGIYAHGPALFFRLQLNNRSPLDYDVDSVRFLVTATGRGKQSLAEVRLLTPVYVYDSTSTVPGHSRVTSIFVLPRFTLPPGRQLLIHIQEKNGGRSLEVQTTNWTLERARSV